MEGSLAGWLAGYGRDGKINEIWVLFSLKLTMPGSAKKPTSSDKSSEQTSEPTDEK